MKKWFTECFFYAILYKKYYYMLKKFILPILLNITLLINAMPEPDPNIPGHMLINWDQVRQDGPIIALIGIGVTIVGSIGFYRTLVYIKNKLDPFSKLKNETSKTSKTDLSQLEKVLRLNPSLILKRHGSDNQS
jgi:hypothetical protein